MSRLPRSLAVLGVALAVATACAPGAGEGPNVAATDPAATGTESPSASTTPAPAPTNRFRFLAIGDYGTGLPEQYAIGQRMCRLRERRGFDHVVTAGDNVYDDGDPALFDEKFFRPFACLLDGGVQFRAAFGNHDIRTDNGRPMLEEPAFGMKGRNYVWRAGGVRFVMVDSNDFNYDWLRRALVTQEGDRWTVVAFHHPVFSSGVYGPTPGLRPRLPRMFRNKGVDLVLNAHEHHYEVSNELRGIRYVVTGGGGASVRPCGANRWFRNVCFSRFHFLEIIAGPDEILVKAIPPKGRFFHRFTTDGRE